MASEQGLCPKEIISHIEITDTEIPISRQVELLGVSRGSFYYEPVPTSSEDIFLMDKIDTIYTDCPFYGSRKIAKELTNRLRTAINRKRVQRLMRIMDIEALYQKKNLSVNNLPHPTFPYLLRNLDISRPNQVWGTDITYLKVNGGFLYLTAIIDWYSRFVLAWRLSNTLDNHFCLEAAKEATDTYGIPEITNSDQGVQYTSRDYIDFWQNKNVNISMDGRGRAMDNIFTERLWRSVKYEEVYLNGYQNGNEALERLTKYFDFYNYRRLHQTLGYLTPAQVYLEGR